jgi:hypothetical protein
MRARGDATGARRAVIGAGARAQGWDRVGSVGELPLHNCFLLAYGSRPCARARVRLVREEGRDASS